MRSGALQVEPVFINRVDEDPVGFDVAIATRGPAAGERGVPKCMTGATQYQTGWLLRELFMHYLDLHPAAIVPLTGDGIA